LFQTLTCTRCGAEHDPAALQTICTGEACGRPLAARYTVEPLPRPDPGAAAELADTIWRFSELLPVGPETEILTLGEGGTPLLRAPRLGRAVGVERLYIKDEAGNPTGSFKARGMAVAVTKAVELGAEAIAVPTAGNAGSAAAAYAARAGIGCAVVMPADTPPVFKREVVDLGAELVEHDGLIDECGRIVAEQAAARGWFDVSTLKEPYRVEGKKTMGTEIAEQLGWELPDAIVYPTGGGTGLVGMWKAFAELGQLGWIGASRTPPPTPPVCACLVRSPTSGSWPCCGGPRVLRSRCPRTRSAPARASWPPARGSTPAPRVARPGPALVG
jgi:threonine synthase